MTENKVTKFKLKKKKKFPTSYSLALFFLSLNSFCKGIIQKKRENKIFYLLDLTLENYEKNITKLNTKPPKKKVI